MSRETEPKEQDFRGLFTMHVKISCGILKRFGITLPYLYGDLFAGPGNLEFEMRRFPGSPMIAWELLNKYQQPYEMLCFERDAAVAAVLEQTLPTSQYGSHRVFAEECQVGFAAWLEAAESQPWRFGLIYTDPIRDEIPYELLNQAVSKFQRVDLLSYFSATQYKRRRGGDQRLNGNSDRPLVSDHILAVRKKFAMIRKPHTGDAWQFSFVLWTNWDRFPVWTKAGFYRVDSPEGQAILDQLDLTRSEYNARGQEPLL